MSALLGGRPARGRDPHFPRVGPRSRSTATSADAGWGGATRVETFYETNPGDNVPPKVRTSPGSPTTRSSSTSPSSATTRSPGRSGPPSPQRDILGGDTDYGGIILDTRNDGRTAILFLANPRGIQYDAVTDDGNEDSSPDFFWDSAGKITATGWTLEIRIPFSSLRYERKDAQTWGILVYRNRPRDFRYQMFSAKLPRGRNCFICSENVLTGPRGPARPAGTSSRPRTSTASQETVPPRGRAAALVAKPGRARRRPRREVDPARRAVALDATINPDFSQIESDVARIGVNERFALFYPEKRPFFLEGVDLLSTPVPAVYTRSITSPRWGLRGTGKFDAHELDRPRRGRPGGRQRDPPGAEGSELRRPGLLLARRSSAASGTTSAAPSSRSSSPTRRSRAAATTGSSAPTSSFSPTEARHDHRPAPLLAKRDARPPRPRGGVERPDALGPRGRRSGWSHSTETVDWAVEYKDFSDGFRADLGFVPQVGFPRGVRRAPATRFARRASSRVSGPSSSPTTSPTGRGTLLSQVVVAAASASTAKYNSIARFEFRSEKVLAGDTVLPRARLVYTLQAAPVRWLGTVVASTGRSARRSTSPARAGDTAARTAASVIVRPGNHLELDLPRRDPAG